MVQQGVENTFKRLLAKSSGSPNDPKDRETLPRHIQDVVETARALVESIGDQSLQSLELRETYDVKALLAAVARGAFLHDLGKANHQFQRMVRAGSRQRQALRHEWISAWLPLQFGDMDQWIFAGCEESVRWSALFSALGHHLKIEDGSSITDRSGSGDDKVVLLCDHLDFQSCLLVARNSMGLSNPPKQQRLEIDLLNRPLGTLRSWLVDAQGWHERADPDMRRFVALVKAMVIAADVAGSAVPKQGDDPARWTREVLRRVCTECDLNGIVQTKLAAHRPRDFQNEMAQSESQVTFVKAGCGSGKTVGAYLWAARYAAGRKLFVCYPTTGTATEGFRDYVIPSEMDRQSALLHSRSEVDLEDLLETQENDVLERVTRMGALAAWDVPLVICTTDQVLGLVQNNRRALFAFPSIGNGAFVFDEIHQYDDRLFGALLRFLDTFRGAPTLLMTASLSESQLRAIETVLNRRGTKLRIIEGPTDLEQIERYELQGPLDEPPWETVEAALTQKGKVLWVANTVDRAVRFAQEAIKRGVQTVLPYHSRYRYGDRVKKHDAVVSAFKDDTAGPVLAVTTQVCEVSLDLSAGLLVSDLAPVPAIIQRLGRLNRRVTPENPGKPCAAIILEPGRSLPYEKEDLDTARQWLKSLDESSVSQRTLSLAFEKIAQALTVPPVESAWLDGGPFSKPAPLREADATIAVVRAEDEAACVDRNGRQISREVMRYAIPMTVGPVANEIASWKRLGFVFVAPEGRIVYSEEWGAQWAKK